jgi:hypothetical protein
MKKEKTDMKWLVENRCAIQTTALDLHLLLEEAESIKDLQNSLTKQDLVGVLFCLWRGVFLAHGKKSEPGDPPTAAIEFLAKVIEDNSIGFSDDKNWREWTANFYVDCAAHLLAGFTGTSKSKATSRLETVGTAWKLDEYPTGVKERWTYNHENLKAKMQSFHNQVRTKITRKWK